MYGHQPDHVSSTAIGGINGSLPLDLELLDRPILRQLTNLNEFQKCEALQRQVWGPEDVVFVPALVLITARHNGGIVIGAFDREDELLGFVCSFPGLTESSQVKQCSQLLAINPAYQRQGIGYFLKWAQRDVALAQGISLITWTFDPLQSVNANLNIKKLGATASQYLVNIYGTPKRGLNAGMPSDRLVVEWRLEPNDTERQAGLDAAHPATAAPQINEVADCPESGFPMIGDCSFGLTDPVLRLEIPAEIGKLKASRIDLARAWRQKTQALLLHYFERDYRIVGFEPVRYGSERRPRYILQRGFGQ
ncbi:MAG: hypothetical protein ACR2RF_20710 [Geminicoccaceae bacterium]